MRLSAWFAPAVLPPVFARSMPADRSRPVPPGRPDPRPPTAAVALGAQARWVACPPDRQLHLVRPDGVLMLEVVTATDAHALCGRLVCAEGLTLSGPSAGMCVSCLGRAWGSS